MPISFLNPTLLLGTMAAALPVIIHFLSRRRVQHQKFSDLRFLDEVQSRQARSLGVRRWLLLLLRVLAILCVALAVAGPRWGGLGDGSGARSVLFVVDNSASMSTGQEEGTRLAEALRVCEDMIRVLPGDTAVQVMVAGSRTRAVFGDWLPAGAGAIGGLSLVQPTDGAFDQARVFAEAARLVARAPGSPVQIVLLSDLQDGLVQDEWETGAGRLLAAGEANLLVRRIGETVSGGGVLAVDLPGRAVRPGENITLQARVVPQFDEQVFALELDGRPVAEVVTNDGVGQPVDISFALTVPGVGRHLGVVRKDTDAMPADDSRPFVLEVPRQLDVLVVHGQDQPRDGVIGRGGWRYLVEALNPGGDGSLFRTSVLASAELTTGAITAADVVYFVDPDPLGRRALQGLQDWVRGGGQAVILAGDPVLTSYLTGTLLPTAGLPPEVGFAAVAAPGQHTRLVDAEHPVFQGLDSTALTTFEEVAWRRWFRLQEGAGRVLVALTGDDPLLIESPVEAGRIVLMASDLQPASGDLAGSPMALPFFQRLTAWLASSGGTVAANTEVGREAVFRPRSLQARAMLEKAEGLLVLDAAGDPAGAADLVWHQGEPQLRGGGIDRAGYVTFLAGTDTLGVVAAGLPAAESELNLRSALEYGQLLADLGLELAGDLTDSDPADFMATLGGREMSSWLLALALALLLVELGVGRGARA
ncbi:MAG: BatA domain-containing protein [Candidatus Krumholzibacteria bacterium]|nr:BatA domain-containing protein [Candidatus Krumholzibacteria bacterium]